MEPVTTAALIAGGASLLGGLLSNKSNRENAEGNAALQREFAQQGIQWKVEDARRAGIHPLYALGAQTHSFSPIAVQDSVGSSVASAGQDISRAVLASADQQERKEAETRMFMLEAARRSDERVYRAAQEAREERRLALDETNATIRNTVLLDQLKRQRAPGTGPGIPKSDDGQGDARGKFDRGQIKLKPAEQTARDPVRPSAEAGSSPMWRRMETAPGVFRDFPTPDANIDSEIMWTWLAAQAYIDKFVSEKFFGGAPKYIQVPKRRYEPSPGAYDMDRGYQRPGVFRKGK